MPNQTHILKIALLCLAFTVLGSGLSNRLAFAESQPWGWNGFAGVHGTSSDSELGDGGRSSVASPVLLGLRLWQSLASWVRVEGELPVGVTKSRDQVATLFYAMPRLQGRVMPLGTDGLISPSLVLGAGLPLVTSTKQSSVPSDVHGAAYVGAGINLKLKGLRIGLEGRYVAIPLIQERSVAHEWELLVSFGIGGTQTHQPKKNKAEIRSDRDGDGIWDKNDKCPDSAEDKDGFEDKDGCPELDNDDDGVLDGLDRCPKEKETLNGFEDSDGCADTINDEMRLLEGVISGVRFETGSGVMEEGGLQELDRLVQVLRDNPSVKVELSGYADSQEVPAEELEALSIERADSVLQYFIEMGLGHGRVYSVGHGAADPLADNSTSIGRRANRRVEINIVQRGD